MLDLSKRVRRGAHRRPPSRPRLFTRRHGNAAVVLVEPAAPNISRMAPVVPGPAPAGYPVPLRVAPPRAVDPWADTALTVALSVVVHCPRCCAGHLPH